MFQKDKDELGYTSAGLKRVGALLRNQRGEMKLRQFYKISGISVSHIRRLEEGLIKEPGSDTVMRIAAITKHTVEEIEAMLRGKELLVAEHTLTRPEIFKIIQHQLSIAETWQLSRDLQKYLEEETSK